MTEENLPARASLMLVRDAKGLVPKGSCGAGYHDYYDDKYIIQGHVVVDAVVPGRVWQLDHYNQEANHLIVKTPGHQARDGMIVEVFDE